MLAQQGLFTYEPRPLAPLESTKVHQSIKNWVQTKSGEARKRVFIAQIFCDFGELAARPALIHRFRRFTQIKNWEAMRVAASRASSKASSPRQ